MIRIGVKDNGLRWFVTFRPDRNKVAMEVISIKDGKIYKMEPVLFDEESFESLKKALEDIEFGETA